MVARVHAVRVLLETKLGQAVSAYTTPAMVGEPVAGICYRLTQTADWQWGARHLAAVHVARFANLCFDVSIAARDCDWLYSTRHDPRYISKAAAPLP